MKLSLSLLTLTPRSVLLPRDLAPLLAGEKTFTEIIATLFIINKLTELININPTALWQDGSYHLISRKSLQKQL